MSMRLAWSLVIVIAVAGVRGSSEDARQLNTKSGNPFRLDVIPVQGASSTSDSPTPAAMTIAPGDSNVADVSVSRNETTCHFEGTTSQENPTNCTGAITLSVAALPAGMTGCFVTPTGSCVPALAAEATVLVLSATSVKAGTYRVRVTAEAVTGPQPRSQSVSIDVTVEPPGLTVAPSFSLAMSPAKPKGLPGQTASAVVSVIPGEGFTEQVSVSISGVPPGVKPIVRPLGLQHALTLAIDAGVQIGDYGLVVQGTAPSRTRTLNATLDVVPFAVTIDPRSLTFGRFKSANVAVTVARAPQFSGPVALGLVHPVDGITGAFEPNPASRSASTLTLTAGSAVSPASYRLRVVGKAASSESSADLVVQSTRR